MRWFLLALVFPILWGCKPYHSNSIKGSYVNVSDTSFHHPKSENIIYPYRDSLSKSMNRIIGYSDTVMSSLKPQGLLGNFVCDILIQDIPSKPAFYFLQNEICFSLLNTRGFRSTLPKGQITVETIFSIMPFENTLLLVQMPESSANDIAKSVLDKKGQPVSGNIQIKQTGDTTAQLNYQGKPIDRDFWVITTDYLVDGGDEMFFFSKAKKIIPVQLLLRDAIIQHIEQKHKNGQTLNARLDGRIEISK
jgi:2',3'-cyclic-nucleotide 2'-phosphodiesterase (5'-nucleotidase family)